MLTTITDVNECTEGMNQCQEICQNMIGSYTCDCNDGFMLSTDGRSCIGNKFNYPYFVQIN